MSNAEDINFDIDPNPPRARKIPYPSQEGYEAYERQRQANDDRSYYSGDARPSSWGGSTQVGSSNDSRNEYRDHGRGREDNYACSDGFYDSDEECHYPTRTGEYQQGNNEEMNASSRSSQCSIAKSDVTSSTAPSYHNGHCHSGADRPRYNGDADRKGYMSESETSDGGFSTAQSGHSDTYPARIYRDGRRRTGQSQDMFGRRSQGMGARGLKDIREQDGDEWSEVGDEDD